jgi:cytochrome c
MNHTRALTVSMALTVALLLLPSLNPTVAAQSDTTPAERGKALFQKRCTGCHSLDNDMEGPRLRGVYGRKAGAVPTFTYSDALKSAHITWNDQSLEKWLTNPDALVPGNDMSFHVPKPEERQDIIQFLRVVSEK